MIILSGLIWFGAGFYLLQLGLSLLLTGVNVSTELSTNFPLINFLSEHLGSGEIAALILIAVALCIGYFKGYYVLGKSAHRGVARILTFPNPAPLSRIYSAKYYILLAFMMALGVSIKYLGLDNDVRGFIDAIIGSALINGAMVYFRLAQTLRQQA